MAQGFGAIGPGMARMRFDPAVFEIYVSQDEDPRDLTRRIRVGWRSQRCNQRQYIDLASTWTNQSRNDPAVAVRHLVQFIEQGIGQGITHICSSFADPSAMVAALMPHFEREIFGEMERMERSARWQDHPTITYDPADFEAGWLSVAVPGARPADSEASRKKARELLVAHLDGAQIADYERAKEFTVLAKDGKRYIISTARSFNVLGPDGVKYCGQLVDTPIEDQMLAQKLLLEHDPDKFFKNANRTGGPATTGREIMDRMDAGNPYIAQAAARISEELGRLRFDILRPRIFRQVQPLASEESLGEGTPLHRSRHHE